MRTRHNPIYRLLNRDYHETFDLYTARQNDFHDMVSEQLPTGWEIKRNGIWFHCGNAKNVVPEQGWKIHISAARANAREVLGRVISVLFAAGDSNFKFALDLPTLFLLNGKNWPRGGSGKFITIYPANGRFLELIEQLHLATREFRGPYILSDHCYKDSHSVFFRYGGMKLREVLDVRGERTPMLVGPDGTQVPDRRAAYPATPAWVEPILNMPEQSAGVEDSYSLREGRYQIEGVIDFSNAGGVYRAIDRHSGNNVIIKEARPGIETSDNNDAIALLKKEHRFLTLLADTGIAPQPVELFQEGTHWFLAQEYVKGLSLGAHSATRNVLLRTRPSQDDFQSWYGTFRQIALRLIESVRILHSRNIVFSDLSPNNVIVTEANELKMIDFEGAYQSGVDQPSAVYTPGFVSQHRLEGAVAGFEDDFYSLGAVLMAYLMPVNGLFHLKPEAKKDFISSIERDARLPQSAAQMVLALMERGETDLGTAANLSSAFPPECAAAPELTPEPAQEYNKVLDGIIQHTFQTATFDRMDRLFPADPKLFATNPLSLAYGACGVAYAVKKVTDRVPQPITDWILSHHVTRETYAPGLYTGMSGITWTLLEMDERKPAEKLFQRTFDHPLLSQSSDMFYGLAGWGMTCLRFFQETGDELYLRKAIECGNRLLRGSNDDRGRAWEQKNRQLGFAHGASGIALYLLYLYLVTGEERFLAAGKEALASELAAGITTPDGGLAWGSAIDSQNTIYPYWRHGSAGVGIAVVRYLKVLGDDVYRRALEKIFIDTDRQYAVLPGRFVGLAGLGDFLLDAWTFTGEQMYLESARKVAQGVMKFSVNRDGIAFPGDFLSRLCCDFGTGSAGIALFLNRLSGGHGADFLLDNLLGVGKPQPQVSLSVAV